MVQVMLKMGGIIVSSSVGYVLNIIINTFPATKRGKISDAGGTKTKSLVDHLQVLEEMTELRREPDKTCACGCHS